jgi:hypothetical protein
LHGEFVDEQAERLAKRAEAAAGEDLSKQAGEVLRIALGRAATEEEVADGVKLIQRLVDKHGQNGHAALKYWCLTVLNLNEFVYLD